MKEFARLRMGLPLAVGLAVVFLVGTMASAQAVKKGGTLRIGTPTDAASLDPHENTAANSAWVYNNIYEPLVLLDNNLKLEPWLATSWEQVNDTTWRFHLRHGVKFTDGTPFDASAVKFNIDRTIDPKNPGRGASWIGPIVGAKVIDPYTVDIMTSSPDPALLNALSMKFVLGMVSPTAVKKYGQDFGHHPVGTGPYMLKEWVNNDHITLVQNPDYWGQKPHIASIDFKVIPDDGSRLLAFQNKEIDMLLNPTPVQLQVIRAMPNVQVHSAPGVRLDYLGLNASQPPMNDVHVRQAIAYALNVNAINQQVMKGIADPPESFEVSGAFGFKNEHLAERYAYDPAKAKQLFEEAGWKDTNNDGILDKNGQDLQVNFIMSPGRDPGDKQVAQVIQQQLHDAGVKVNLKFMEWAPYLAVLKDHPEQYGMYFLGWSTLTLDSDFGLNSLFNSANIPPNGVNRMRYSNPKVDALLNAAQSDLNKEQRASEYGQVQDILANDMPMVPLYHLRQIVVTQPWLMNYTMNPAEYYVTTITNAWLNR